MVTDRRIFEAFNKKGDVKVFKPEREWKKVKGSQTALGVRFEVLKNEFGGTLDAFEKLDVFGFMRSP